MYKNLEFAQDKSSILIFLRLKAKADITFLKLLLNQRIIHIKVKIYSAN